MQKKNKARILFNLLFWPTFLVSAQYYLLFPGVFVDLASHVNESNEIIKVDYIDKNSPKHIYYRSTKENAPLLIYFHGNYESIDENLNTVLSQTKYEVDVLMVEYRGYGNSSGFPTTSNIIKDAEKALIKYKRSKDQKLVIWGRSLGGRFASKIALSHNPDLLILESTFLHASNRFSNKTLANIVRPLIVFDFNTQKSLEKLPSTIPVKLIHGDKDELFDVSVSHEMHELLKSKNQPVTQHIFDGGHNDRNYKQTLISNYISTIWNSK